MHAQGFTSPLLSVTEVHPHPGVVHPSQGVEWKVVSGGWHLGGGGDLPSINLLGGIDTPLYGAYDNICVMCWYKFWVWCCGFLSNFTNI